MADTYTPFSELLPCKFRDITFPISELSDQGGHETAELMPLLGSGSYIESMGRKSDRINVTALFYTEIAASQEEDDFQDLFPNRLNDLLDALRNPDPGELQHPLRGKMNVRVENWQFKLLSNERNGTSIDISFVEHHEPNEEQQPKFLLFIDSLKADLEARMTDKVKADIEAQNAAEDVETTMQQIDEGLNYITAAVDTASLYTRYYLGYADRTIGKLLSLKDHVILASDEIYDAANICGTLDKIIAAILESRKTTEQQAEQGRQTRVERVNEDIEVSLYASSVGNTLDELVTLNPQLAYDTLIPAGSSVSHYIS